MKSHFRLAFLMLLSFVVSCSVFDDSTDDPPEGDGPVPFKVLSEQFTGRCWIETSGLDDSYRNKDEGDLSGIEIIITNQSNFNRYISCNVEPEIDFSEYIILAGKSKWHHQCIYIHEQSVHIQSGILTYSVEIGELDCQAPESATYIVAVSEEYLQYPIEFDIFWGEY